MKLLLKICILLVLAACEENEPQGDPVQFNDYFQIVDATTGEDWFLAHPNYNPENVRVDGYGSKEMLLSFSLPYESINNRMVFGPALLKPALPNEEKMVYYIYFDNQDIDTLERIANRCSDRCSEGNYRGVSSITYYYNGQLAEHLDFRIDRSKAIDDDIVYRLGRTNQTLTDSTFVMVFEKRPE